MNDFYTLYMAQMIKGWQPFNIFVFIHISLLFISCFVLLLFPTPYFKIFSTSIYVCSIFVSSINKNNDIFNVLILLMALILLPHLIKYFKVT